MSSATYINSLIQKLRRALNKLNVRQFLMKHRPDTKWKPFLVTNAIFVIDNTNYALGQGQTTLLDYVMDKESLHGPSQLIDIDVDSKTGL
jgi:hypothetical protein